MGSGNMDPSLFENLYSGEVIEYRRGVKEVSIKGTYEEVCRPAYGGYVVVSVYSIDDLIEVTILDREGAEKAKSFVSPRKTGHFKLAAKPDDELRIVLRSVVKPVRGKIEVAMYTLKDAVKLSIELEDLLEVLNEFGKKYYIIGKAHIQEMLKRAVSIWRILPDNIKENVRKLIELVERFEEQ